MTYKSMTLNKPEGRKTLWNGMFQVISGHILKSMQKWA